MRVTDSKGLYDIMRHTVITSKWKVRRVGIECLALQEGLESSSTMLFWAHSGAQLGNSLTKDTETEPLPFFLRNGHRWKVISDPRFMSAETRCAAGIRTPQTPSEEDLNVEGPSS